MSGRKSLIFTVFLIVILTIPMFASANSGVAISSPKIESLTVMDLPYSYENQFRVYNNGDEDGLYSVEATTEYPDVKEWVSFDEDSFTLGPRESIVVSFAINAYDSYSGEYPIYIAAKSLPMDSETGESGTGASAFISLSQGFEIDISVPNGNLGERPIVTATPTPEVPAKVEEAAEEIAATDEGVVVKEFDKPISLDIPSKVTAGEEVELSASFIGGGEPFGMGLTLVSPSGKSYELSRTAVFTFDETGTWSVMVVINDEVILGKSVEVMPGTEKANTASAMPIPLVVPVGALVLAVPLMRRIMRRQ